MEQKMKETNLSQVIQCLLIDTILLKGRRAILDHIIHDALIYSAL